MAKSASHLLVPTEAIRLHLETIFPKIDIHSTGHPRFSKLAEVCEGFDRLETCEEAKLEVGKRYLIYTTQYSKDNDQRLQLLISVIKKNWPEMELIIAVHPNQDKKHYQEICANAGITTHILNRTRLSLHKAILLSEILFTESSTTGFESLLLGRDTIHILAPEDNPMNQFNICNGYADFATNEIMLKRVIEDCFVATEQVKKMREKRTFLRPSTGATERIIQLLQQNCEKR